MAQSVRESRKTPLSIEPFWKRPTSDPPIRWEKWRIQLKLAILARENMKVDALLQTKATTVRLPVKPKYKLAIKDSTKDTERDRKNKQQSTEASMGIDMPKYNGDRRFVWRTTMASM